MTKVNVNRLKVYKCPDEHKESNEDMDAKSENNEGTDARSDENEGADAKSEENGRKGGSNKDNGKESALKEENGCRKGRVKGVLALLRSLVLEKLWGTKMIALCC